MIHSSWLSHIRRGCLIIFAIISIPAVAQWKAFKWGEFQQNKVTNPRAAILLPVVLDGVRCTMQLDTGVGSSVLYRNALPSRYSQSLNTEKLVIKKFSLGSDTSEKIFHLQYERDKLSRDCRSSGDRIVGTLANDFFANGTLRLDLAAQQYQFNLGPLPTSENAQLNPVDFEIIKANDFGIFPIAKLSVDNIDRKMVFDTGSASLDLVIFLKKNWLTLVDLKDIAELVPSYIPRFGRMVPCYSARVDKPISLGDMALGPNMKAMYCDDPRDNPREDNQVFGLLGLAPFLGARVTIDYVSEKMYIDTK